MTEDKWMRIAGSVVVVFNVAWMAVAAWVVSPWIAMLILTWGAFWYEAVARNGAGVKP